MLVNGSQRSDCARSSECGGSKERNCTDCSGGLSISESTTTNKFRLEEPTKVGERIVAIAMNP